MAIYSPLYLPASSIPSRIVHIPTFTIADAGVSVAIQSQRAVAANGAVDCVYVPTRTVPGCIFEGLRASKHPVTIANVRMITVVQGQRPSPMVTFRVHCLYLLVCSGTSRWHEWSRHQNRDSKENQHCFCTHHHHPPYATYHLLTGSRQLLYSPCTVFSPS